MSRAARTGTFVVLIPLDEVRVGDRLEDGRRVVHVETSGYDFVRSIRLNEGRDIRRRYTADFRGQHLAILKEVSV